MTPQKERFELYRQQQMNKLGTLVAGPISSLLVLQSTLTDYRLYPHSVNKIWLLLRLGILPISSLSVWLIWKNQKKKLWSDFSIWIVASYIAGFHAFFLSQTGYEASKYFHSYIQICLGIAIVPVLQLSFWIILLTVISIYVGTVLIGGESGLDFLTHGDAMFLKTYIIMSVLLYYSIRAARYASYRAQMALEDEILRRDLEIQRLVIERTKIREDEILLEIARQVAHDIRSPLAALEVVASELKSVPDETQTLASAAIKRIREIANNLLKKPTNSKYSGNQTHLNTTEQNSLEASIICVLNEKRAQYRNRPDLIIEQDISKTISQLKTTIETSVLLRILSNLIDNSVEAIRGKGHIQIEAKDNEEEVEFIVRDNGIGMPPRLLRKIGTRGVTFGKPDGTGLGLFHARTTIEECGGRMNVESLESRGTSVFIRLPKIDSPSWHGAKLNVDHTMQVVSLDDDPLIEKSVRSIFHPKQPIVFFRTEQELRNWFNNFQGFKTLFLIDYELSPSNPNGIEIIQELNIVNQSILVTANYESLELRKKCEGLALSILPKSKLRKLSYSALPKTSLQPRTQVN